MYSWSCVHEQRAAGPINTAVEFSSFLTFHSRNFEINKRHSNSCGRRMTLNDSNQSKLNLKTMAPTDDNRHQRRPKMRRRRAAATQAGACICLAAAAATSLYPGKYDLSTTHLRMRSNDAHRHLASAAVQQQDEDIPKSDEESSAVISPYNRHDVFSTQRHFAHPNAVLYFDGTTNTLQFYHHPHANVRIVRKFTALITVLARALRLHFPHRFQVGQSNFQLLFEARDNPDTPKCLQHPTDCNTDQFAPIVAFGSVPQDETMLPTALAYPVMTYLPCLFEPSKCPYEEVLSDESRPSWDELKSQLVWRGSAFAFLVDFGLEYSMGSGLNYNELDPHVMSRTEVAENLMERWEELTPRWRSVALSLQALADAEEAEVAAGWIDSRFLIDTDPSSASTYDKAFHSFLEEGHLVATGDHLDNTELSLYKYHIDLGGGGGTSWTGTLQKLAMPGLLFHHESLTKDWFYDDLVPWKHYVPVDITLSNLRERFGWAEAHPEEAQKIAEAGTEFVRDMISKERSQQTYERLFVEQLGRIVEAYQPEEGESVNAVLDEYAQENMQMELLSTCDLDSCTHHVYDGRYGIEKYVTDQTPEWLLSLDKRDSQ